MAKPYVSNSPKSVARLSFFLLSYHQYHKDSIRFTTWLQTTVVERPTTQRAWTDAWPHE